MNFYIPLFKSKRCVPLSPAVNPAPVPAPKPSPQLDQLPIVRHGVALPTSDAAKVRGDVDAIYTHSGIPPSSKRPSTGQSYF